MQTSVLLKLTVLFWLWTAAATCGLLPAGPQLRGLRGARKPIEQSRTDEGDFRLAMSARYYLFNATRPLVFFFMYLFTFSVFGAALHKAIIVSAILCALPTAGIAQRTIERSAVFLLMFAALMWVDVLPSQMTLRQIAGQFFH